MNSSNQEKLFKIRHSCAHILAQAVKERFEAEGPVHLGGGPPIEDGFYYDFRLPRSPSDQDIEWLEARMREIIGSACRFEKEAIDETRARALFADQPFKIELIDLIAAGKAGDNGEAAEEVTGAPTLSIYRHDGFFDLCKGPHVEDSSQINPEAIKIVSVAGAYWRGSERNPMLVRIYATAWESKEALDQYLEIVEKRKSRDHRMLGKRLELFHFDQSAPGMPYWLPNGLIVLNELIDYWRRVHRKHGYKEFSAPIINDKRLWEISGHWEHYRDSMFVIEEDEDTVFGVKPMNCPNAMVIFNLRVRSYRELPLRLSDCDVLHRNERSGTLSGLLRVQKFQQDDAHIFLAEEQLEDEFDRVLDLCHEFYRLFDLEYSFRLSKRPDEFVGSIEKWNKAEAILETVLEKRVGKGNFQIAPGEGAFYGPKIDILMRDSLGRKWQMGTIQLDFQLPARFGCHYADNDGSRKVPCVIHRVIYGSLDRFIGILLEHTGGALPAWLSPVQVVVAPVSDRHLDYARLIRDKLSERDIRTEVSEVEGTLGKRVREAVLMKVPYIVIVGDKEAASSCLTLRLRDGSERRDLAMDEALRLLQAGTRVR